MLPEGRSRDLEIHVVRAEGRGGPPRSAIPAGSPRRGRGGSDDGTGPLTPGSGLMGSKDRAGISGCMSCSLCVRCLQSASWALAAWAPDPAQDLLGCPVWGAVLQELLSQAWVLPKGQPGLLPGELGDDLGGLVPEPRFGKLTRPAARLEVLAVGLDGRPKLFDPLLVSRHGGDDRRLPWLLSAGTARARGVEAQHPAELHHDALMPLEVSLVDDENVCDLEDSCLDHLHAVPEVRCQDDDRRIGDGRHL